MGGGRRKYTPGGGWMKRVVAVIAVGLIAAACGHTDLQRPATQDDFGVQMAKMNLWREAMFRFKRAVQIDPNDARAHSNLAVAYETTGDFEIERPQGVPRGAQARPHQRLHPEELLALRGVPLAQSQARGEGRQGRRSGDAEAERLRGCRR